MAHADTVALRASWADLRANPVFQRAMVPRGLRGLLRSPFPRALGLTIAAVALFYQVERQFLSMWPLLFAAIVFWFLVRAIQHYFGWLELTALAGSGTLADYINSGLSRADVAMGVIYPAELSERVATLGVLIWFLLTTENNTVRIVLVFFIFMQGQNIIRSPQLFLPDVETYLRKRNPIALAFISVAVVVPILIWFAIYYTIYFALIFGLPLLGQRPAWETIYLTALVATYFLSQWPSKWWSIWRLKRFYSRYRSFDDLFERYIESGESQ